MNRIKLAYLRIIGRQWERGVSPMRPPAGLVYEFGTYWSPYLLESGAREVIEAEFREVPSGPGPGEPEKPTLLARLKAWFSRLWMKSRPG